MGFCELETQKGVMRRKESSREKMGCFRERIPNRLSCNGALVIGNCSIMRMPGKMAVMTAMITFKGKGRRRKRIAHHGEGVPFSNCTKTLCELAVAPSCKHTRTGGEVDAGATTHLFHVWASIQTPYLPPLPSLWSQTALTWNLAPITDPLVI